MSANYSRLRKWSDKFTPQIKQIVGNELVEIADFEADTHETTDMIVGTMKPLKIAMRIRKHEYLKEYAWQITLRKKVVSGNPTEIHKITDGFGDLYFYGFANEDETDIALWYLIDLDKFRSALIKYQLCRNNNKWWGEFNNSDGTAFMWFNLLKLPKEIITCSSHPIGADVLG